jgi:hypothetical protein
MIMMMMKPSEIYYIEKLVYTTAVDMGGGTGEVG